ncbi:SDR family oxidoreductase [Salipiger sp. IMCC34102]|uniref:SDR family NAD(P)-dependent oxidoreductase n=1 Tax=Salipiger sp. IMCC34102 TaxID=2510647 RepID=UPI00101B7DC0|nr:SDR family oxidoreductase [Salipiger sp. IMCC34102]RYH02209.1 SDR family oxidoreductase [Salipiger sp. IMCC34102]
MTARFDELDGKGVLVTGGASGIGAAYVAAFAAQGARVISLDIQKPDAPVDGVDYRHCDLTDTAALQREVEGAGPLRCLLNNAANDLRMALDEVTEPMWEDMIAVNLRPYFFAAQAAARVMEDGGSIINMSSGSIQLGSAGMTPYVTANGGILAMTRALARELGPRGIRVNTILPGWVLTDKQLEKWVTPERLSAFMDRQCLKEHLEPQDMTGTALFLASDLSRMMTGQALCVDAGACFTG